jgi:hypothetical protein
MLEIGVEEHQDRLKHFTTGIALFHINKRCRK